LPRIQPGIQAASSRELQSAASLNLLQRHVEAGFRLSMRIALHQLLITQARNFHMQIDTIQQWA
tara:strand:+ start:842 stop:1033 length:192 start_codon:yes stop_codon:yes gene_type:complete